MVRDIAALTGLALIGVGAGFTFSLPIACMILGTLILTGTIWGHLHDSDPAATGKALATVRTGYKINQAEGAGALWGMPKSSAGVAVDEITALSLSAVFAACNLISRIVGSLPLSVYQRNGRMKTEADNLQAYRLLHIQPNREATSVTFRRVMDFHRLLWGNAYAEITWAMNGSPVALWNIEPWRVKPKRDESGSLYYEIDGRRKVAPADIIHVPLVSFDGVSGRSFVDFAIDSLGIGIAAQDFSGRLFGNDAKPGGILKHAGTPPEQARKEFRESWQRSHGGPENAGKTAVLWGGWEYTGSDGTFSPRDAQLLEQRKFTTEEVARWIGVPPHLLAELTRATFSNIEEMGRNLVTYSLGPVLVDYEQEYDRKLLSPPRIYSKHNVNALLRGNMAARSQFYRDLFGIGAYAINDILELEDMNPVEGGDVRFVPANMVTLDRAINGPPTAPAPSGPGSDQGGDNAPLAHALDITQRMARIEANELRRAAKNPGKLDTWLDSFYAAHESRMAKALSVITDSPESRRLVTEFCQSSRREIEFISGQATPSQFAGAVEKLLSEWEPRSRDLATEILKFKGDESCRN